MAAVMISGFVLFVAGLAGAVNACLAGPDDRDTTLAAVSGLLFALGLTLLAVGAAKRRLPPAPARRTARRHGSREGNLADAAGRSPDSLRAPGHFSIIELHTIIRESAVSSR